MAQYNTVDVTDTLLRQLVGLNQVGLTYAKSGEPEASEFFPNVEAARQRITELLLDRIVTGFWVGSQEKHRTKLNTLLHNLNKQRGFGAVLSANANAKVYDLAL